MKLLEIHSKIKNNSNKVYEDCLKLFFNKK